MMSLSRPRRPSPNGALEELARTTEPGAADNARIPRMYGGPRRPCASFKGIILVRCGNGARIDKGIGIDWNREILVAWADRSGQRSIFGLAGATSELGNDRCRFHADVRRRLHR